MDQALLPNTTVVIGAVRFGNQLPLALIAGPCVLESKAHALEMASALKEIAGRVGIGLVYKTSFDKANRTSAKSARGSASNRRCRSCRNSRQVESTGPHRHDASNMRASRKRRRVANSGLPLPTNRSSVAAAKTGKVVNVKKGQFPLLGTCRMSSRNYRRGQS